VFCSRVIAISKFAKRHFGLGGRRASVVYNPGPDREIFDIGKYSRISVQDHARDAGAASCRQLPTVIAVASFRKDKGHHNFIEIASKIKEHFSNNVRFVIVGGKVPGHERYYGEMIEKIKQKGFDDCLTVTGNIPHEKVPSVMADAAVLLHVPDWEEALGGVILEAMAMSVTVVAYDCGGVSECFTDGNSGFLVKRGAVDEAVDKVIKILDNPQLREKIASEAKRELDAKFTLEKYVGGVEKIYDELLS
jgi:glycosyltransferase involved in cell wall biosynthesis